MEHKIAHLAVRYRRSFTAAAWVFSVLCLFAVSQLNITTVQTDFLPKGHPYAALQSEFSESFGGANKIALALEVSDDRDIFYLPTLKKIHDITRALEQTAGVNSLTITSLASSKMARISASANGIRSEALMWPDIPADEPGARALRDTVIQTPLAYGRYVSGDLKSALITADLYENFSDYDVLFAQLSELQSQVEDPNHVFRMVGEPIIYGYVASLLNETMLIVMGVLGSIAILLYLMIGTVRAVFFPLLSGLLSCIWTLGICAAFGINLDPLLLPVIILLFARGVSHSLQMVLRFDEEVAKEGVNIQEAATRTLAELLRPGMLGIATDGLCAAAIALSSIPFLQKLALIAVIWVSTIAISASILTPVFLAGYRNVDTRPNWIRQRITSLLALLGHLAMSPARYVVVGLALTLFVISFFSAMNLQIGDSSAGSPIFRNDSKYNEDLAAINSKFGGIDTLMVVARGNWPDAQKDPQVLNAIWRLQRHMEMQNEIVGSFSVADMTAYISRLLHDDNPRFEELANDELANAELLLQLRANSQPGQLESVIDPAFKDSAVQFILNSREGNVIRTSLARFVEFTSGNKLESASLVVGGGVIGMLAAVNDVILADQIESIGIALLILMLICMVVYKSAYAGLFFLVPVVLSNSITFGFMEHNGIGLTINTIPIAAIGIGLGVDYSIYIVDRIKENWEAGSTIQDAIIEGMTSAGLGVVITATVLIVSVLLWQLSSLKFQAKMGQLMGLWMVVSASSALLLTPAMIYIFKPRFVFTRTRTPVISGRNSMFEKPQCDMDLMSSQR